MIDYRDVERELVGQWGEVLLMYGIETGQFYGMNTKNQPCPLCGGTDRAHWRETEGRIALYCRNCAGEKMKSPEVVIMEAAGIEFSDLVKELAEFVNHVPVEVKKKAKAVAQVMPKQTLPHTDKRDYNKSTDLLKSCELSSNYKILLGLGAQYPYELAGKGGHPVFEIVNDNGVIVNLASLIRNKSGQLETRFSAGGLSYGAWHEIPPCNERKTGKTFYCCCIIEAIKHWYKFGDAVRCVFDVNNLFWMMNHNLITEHNTLADKETLNQLFGDD